MNILEETTKVDRQLTTDDQLASASVDINPRAINALARFLDTVAKHDATCGLRLRGEVFHFIDSKEVRRSEELLRQTKFDKAALWGRFQGYLPDSRRAEFYVAKADVEFLRNSIGAVISCKVEKSVAYSTDINEILDMDVRVDALTRRVGSGKPHFTITGYELIPEVGRR